MEEEPGRFMEGSANESNAIDSLSSILHHYREKKGIRKKGSQKGLIAALASRLRLCGN